MSKITAGKIILAAGVCISSLVVLLLPGYYFSPDLDAFWKWAQIWAVDWRMIYTACESCNYPILGMFFSAGLLSWFGRFGFIGSVFVFRLLLSLVDGVNIWLIYWMLKRLKVARPAYMAGVIGISISSWAGGALWGQVDGFGQLFILLSLAWIINKNTSEATRKMNYQLYLAFSAVLLGCLILTKQLTIFSSFTLGLLLAADIIFHTRSWKGFAINAVLSGFVLLATVSLWDIWLQLKPPYHSHLLYNWQEGIFQSGIISGNGFNIWMLLGRDMWSSAHVPIFQNIPLLNPYLLGEVLFILLTVILTISLGLSMIRFFAGNEKQLNREILLNFILHLALINLCFNVFLTGTRERYLFHFYPYIFIAWVGLAGYSSLFSEKILSALILGSAVYGFYVLMILQSILIGPGTTSHMLLAVIHLVLFICLFGISLKYQRFIANLQMIFRK